MKKTRGFSLIEVIITMGILAVTMTIFLAILSWGFRLSRQSERATTLQTDAASALDEMTRDLRGAADVIAATRTTLTVEVYPRYPTASPNRIRYDVTGSRLIRGLTPPFGYPPQYRPEDETVRGLTQSLASNGLQFRYFDENDAELLDPPALGAIAVIEVTLTLEDTSRRTRQPITVTSKAHLRNRKTNL
jgi:prepilin-type N-terminal cleavage/methylation domain-containing protein